MAPSLSGLATLVSDRVTAALHEHTAPFHGLAGMDELLGAGEALLGGGKRLRAAFCTAGWTAFSPEPVVAGSAPVLAGSALELFQGAALAHDDLMDGSHTRRGLPAVHRRMAAEHTANGWQGDPERHGAAGAILLGDLLLTLSSVELDRARDLVDAAASRRARATWDLMTAEVAVGQYLDVRSQVLPWSSQDDVDRSLTVVRHKSARYSVEHPLVLGAALAGADDGALAGLRSVGLPLGIAFQLRDDLLPWTTSEAVAGKPAASDLRNRRAAMPLLLAWQYATPAERARLTALTADAPLLTDDELLAGAAPVLHRTDALARTRELARAHATAAKYALTGGFPPCPHRDRLLALTDWALSRES